MENKLPQSWEQLARETLQKNMELEAEKIGFLQKLRGKDEYIDTLNKKIDELQKIINANKLKV